ncbi:MAG: AMP-binding protein [Clostridiales bacterium]|nr:AMP-binding protein [Clostridiales bacterium]
MRNQKNYAYNEIKPVENIRQMLFNAQEEAGDQIAYKYKDGDDVVSVTYNDFATDVKALGTAIAEKGIHGAHIACVSENSYKYIVAYLAVITSDNVFVPIDKELPTNDIVFILNNSDADYVFFSSTYEHVFRENNETLPNIKGYFGFDLEADDPDDQRFISYEKLVSDGITSLEEGSREYLDEQYDLGALKLLVYTSGTTGIAKGVMLTDKNLSAMVYHGMRVASIYPVGLSVLPYNHTYEAVAGILVAIHYHACLCINDKIRNVAKNINLFKPYYIYVVPAFAEAFYKKIQANLQESGKEKLVKSMIAVSNGLRNIGIDVRRKMFKQIIDGFGGNLIQIVCGGAPIRPEIGEFFDAIGIDLLNGYGITECTPLVSVNRPKFNDYRTVGCLLPCLEVKIEDPDDEGNGEICVKGDTVMLGYYKNDEATASVIVDGWFHTGDYGNVNDKGQLSITGRKKNMIVLNNGKNIYPEEIENYIMSIPYVQEVVVYSKKSASGEEVALIAETYLNEEKLQEMEVEDPVAKLKSDVTEVCRPLPFYKQVAKVIIRREPFEKTAAQKIKRSSITGGEPDQNSEKK